MHKDRQQYTSAEAYIYAGFNKLVLLFSRWDGQALHTWRWQHSFPNLLTPLNLLDGSFHWAFDIAQVKHQHQWCGVKLEKLKLDVLHSFTYVRHWKSVFLNTNRQWSGLMTRMGLLSMLWPLHRLGWSHCLNLLLETESPRSDQLLDQERNDELRLWVDTKQHMGPITATMQNAPSLA